MRVIWRGITRAADAYWDYLNRTGLPDYRAAVGNRGVTVLRRIEGEVAHFTLCASIFGNGNRIPIGDPKSDEALIASAAEGR